MPMRVPLMWGAGALGGRGTRVESHQRKPRKTRRNVKRHQPVHHLHLHRHHQRRVLHQAAKAAAAVLQNRMTRPSQLSMSGKVNNSHQTLPSRNNIPCSPSFCCPGQEEEVKEGRKQEKKIWKKIRQEEREEGNRKTKN